MPASVIPHEIETPGERQLRALFVSAGNPVLSVPDGDAMERALGKLDLLVSLDFYVNETNRHADYVLPTTTFFERDDPPVALSFYTTPFVQHTDAVVPPRARRARSGRSSRRSRGGSGSCRRACRRCAGSRARGSA